MSNIQTGAERMPHDLSHLGFLAGQIGRLITISTTPVIAGDSFEMDAVGALRLSPLRRGLAIDSTVDIFTFYVPHRHVYGEQWIKFMKDGVNATPLPTVNYRPLLVMRSNLWASGYDVDGTDQTSLGQFSGRVQQTYKHSVPRFFVPEHGTMFTLALVRFPPTA